MKETNPHRGFAFDSHFKWKSRHRGCLQIDEPHSLLFLIAISKGRVGAKEVHERDEPHRGSAFDSPGLPNDSAGYPGLICCVGHNAIGVALF